MFNNVFLYIATIFIWGTSWIGISFQLGSVSPTWSITYRFLLSGIILLLYCSVENKSLKFSFTDHIDIAIQGLLLFCFNFIFIYYGSLFLISGFVALIAASIIMMNIFNNWLLMRVHVLVPVFIGALIGLLGVITIFNSELATTFTKYQESDSLFIGIFLCSIGAYSSSLGQVITVRNQIKKNIPVLQSSAIAMIYGAIACMVISLMIGEYPTFDYSFKYISSLIYLSTLGSAVAYVFYLTLISRVGADKGGYVFVLLPILALLLSTLFEDLKWHTNMFLGLLLIVIGNVIILTKHKFPLKNVLRKIRGLPL